MAAARLGDPPITHIFVGGVPPDQVGVASAVTSGLHQLGIVLGVTAKGPTVGVSAFGVRLYGPGSLGCTLTANLVGAP